MTKGKAYPREGERRQCSEISTERYSVIEEELRRMHGSERFDISERARQDIQHHIREYSMAFNACDNNSIIAELGSLAAFSQRGTEHAYLLNSGIRDIVTSIQQVTCKMTVWFNPVSPPP
jgi:hypothetical protein